MKTLVVLGLVLLSLVTMARLPAWRDDVALWSETVRSSPRLPRPALNLGMAYLKRGEHQAAAIWLVRAGELAEGRQGPRDREALILVSRGLVWIEAFGSPVCAATSTRRFC